MNLLSNPNNIGVAIFSVLIIFFNWKFFLKSYNYRKIFDFTYMFLFLGFFSERLISFVQNREGLSGLGYGLLSSEQLPWIALNLDRYQGFSLVIFLAGGLVGIQIYNFINTTAKFSFKSLEVFVRIFLLSLLPWIGISLLFVFLRSDSTFPKSAEVLHFVLRIVLIGILIGLYKSKTAFWESHLGFYSALVLFLFSVFEIVLEFFSPTFRPEIFGAFSVAQLIGVLIVILSINIFLTALSIIQDSFIRKKYAPERDFTTRGFTISFANKRRVSNPLNIRLKNLARNSSRTKRKQDQ